MAENGGDSGSNVWRSLVDFLCALTPQQFILLPTLLTCNIYCATDENGQNMLGNFFSLLGSAISAIAARDVSCEPEAGETDGGTFSPGSAGTNGDSGDAEILQNRVNAGRKQGGDDPALFFE